MKVLFDKYGECKDLSLINGRTTYYCSLLTTGQFIHPKYNEIQRRNKFTEKEILIYIIKDLQNG